MADLGDTSQADTAHKHKTSSWITVGLITLASIVLAVRSLRKHPPVEVGAAPLEATPAH